MLVRIRQSGWPLRQVGSLLQKNEFGIYRTRQIGCRPQANVGLDFG